MTEATLLQPPRNRMNLLQGMVKYLLFPIDYMLAQNRIKFADSELYFQEDEYFAEFCFGEFCFMR